MYFEIYPSGLEWRWRLRGGNHEIIALGESYVRREGAIHAVNLLRLTSTNTPIRFL